MNDTIGKGLDLGCPEFYAYLRLRLPLEQNMVVVSNLHIRIVAYYGEVVL